ncbi:hypermethylated in cancer 2 protein-like isoform X2 [Lepisosteus oculatus]|uniref:hypermethylated in cancer 2 protein-like isoform X2 n=1 Tax=Lepisosteus oculatus TaxID=7918 RepID=UPI00371FF0B4
MSWGWTAELRGRAEERERPRRTQEAMRGRRSEGGAQARERGVWAPRATLATRCGAARRASAASAPPGSSRGTAARGARRHRPPPSWSSAARSAATASCAPRPSSCTSAATWGSPATSAPTAGAPPTPCAAWPATGAATRCPTPAGTAPGPSAARRAWDTTAGSGTGLRERGLRRRGRSRRRQGEGVGRMEELGVTAGLPAVTWFQSLQCLQCFMTFRDQETTERHLRFKHPAEYERQLRGRTVFACCVCDLTFPSSAQLSAHQRTHSKWSLPPGGLEDSLQRERQGGEWDRGEGGERKVEIPMEERPDPEKQRPSPLQQGSGLSSGAALALRCLQCHIIFTDQHTWDRHMRAKHPSPAGHAPLPPRPPRGQPRPYCCPACGERFIQQGSLTQHYSETHSR